MWTKGTEEKSAITVIGLMDDGNSFGNAVKGKNGTKSSVPDLRSSNVQNFVELKRVEFIRRNMLTTLRSSLQSLRLVTDEKKALQKRLNFAQNRVKLVSEENARLKRDIRERNLHYTQKRVMLIDEENVKLRREIESLRRKLSL